MKKLFLLLLFVGSGIFNYAQIGKVERDSVAGYSYETVAGDPLKTRKYVLKNGLSVFMTVNRTAPKIYTCIAIKAGSKHDPKENTGLAHYLEHMLFKGTDKFGTRQYEREKLFLDQIATLYEEYNKTKDEKKRKRIYHEIDSLSGVAAKFAIANEYDKMMQHIGAKGTNAYTSFDETVYINEIPSNQVDTWLKIESERFRKPVLRLFHTELEAVYEEKNISLDSDFDRMFEAAMASLFKNHSYGTQTTIGTIEHLKNPSLKAINEYFDRYYVPNNMGIILAGNFDPDDMIKKVDNAFKGYENKPVKPIRFPEEAQDTSAEIIKIKGLQEPSVFIGYRLPKSTNENIPYFTAIQELLVNQYAGLFEQNLIKKQKLLSADGDLIQMHDHSVLFFMGEPSEGQTLEEVRTLLIAQIDSLKKGKFDEKLLKSIVLNLEKDEVQEMESNAGRAFSLVNLFVKDLSISDAVLSKEKLRKISKSDLVLFIRNNFKNDYAVVMKEQVAELPMEKIVKPEITPIEVNRKDNSRFAKDIYDDIPKPITPQFLDFTKDLAKSELLPGIELLQVKNKENKLFKLRYTFEMGRLNDLRLPIAIELMKLSGTANLTPEGVGIEFFNLACDFTVFAGDRVSVIEISGPEQSFERALSTVEHILSKVKPTEKVLNQLITDQLQGRKNAKFNQQIIRRALNDFALYGEDNPTRYNLTEKQLKKLTVAELTEIINKLTSYKHSVAYYGTLEEAELKRLLTKYHKPAITNLEIPVAKQFQIKEPSDKMVYFTDFNMVQAEITWMAKHGPLDTLRLAKSALFNEYFGGGMSSVVFQEIRESKALAYSSYGYYSFPKFKELPSMAGAYIGTQADKLDSAMFAMNQLILKMPESESLFNSSLSALKSQMVSDRTMPSDIATTYLSLRRQGLEKDTRKIIYPQLNNLSIKDVSDFHASTFSQGKFVVTVVGSSKRISKDTLKKYGKVKVLKSKKIFGY
jgi:predicted Zn-dependent peptidase